MDPAIRFIIFFREVAASLGLGYVTVLCLIYFPAAYKKKKILACTVYLTAFFLLLHNYTKIFIS